MSDSAPQRTNDDRHYRRIQRMKALFAFFGSKGLSTQTHPQLIQQFQHRQEEIDTAIQEAAPEWPLDQMNQVDLAILRTVLLEWKEKKTPVKVLIDEAVEIAKEYGAENSPKLINGVLGKIMGKQLSAA